MDKEGKGFIKLDRNIFEHWIFQDAEKFRAFVDLIQLARWKDEKLLIGNDLVTVPRGSYYTSESKLAARWGWGRDKTRNFLSLLEREKMITKKGTTKGTMLTIENYSVYQDEHPTKYTTKTHQTNSVPTSNQHQTNSEPDTKEEIKEIIRNYKKDKKEKKEETPPPLSSLSFFSEDEQKIHDFVGDVTYRTFFADAEIQSTDKKITIKAKTDFNKSIIRDRWKENLKIELKKEIEVIS